MSNGTQKLNWVSEFWRFQDFSVKINDFGALIFQELLFSNIFVDFVQKQFSCIGGKHRKSQHCGFQKKAIKQKKFKRLEMNTQRCKKIKGNGDAIWWMLNKQTNKQTKQTPVNADCIFSTTMYYLQWFKAAVCEYSSFWWDLYVITVCSWDSIAVIRCSQCE